MVEASSVVLPGREGGDVVPTSEDEPDLPYNERDVRLVLGRSTTNEDDEGRKHDYTEKEMGEK